MYRLRAEAELRGSMFTLGILKGNPQRESFWGLRGVSVRLLCGEVQAFKGLGFPVPSRVLSGCMIKALQERWFIYYQDSTVRVWFE